MLAVLVALGLSVALPVAKAAPPAAKPAKVTPNDLTCDLCQDIVNMVEELLLDGLAKPEIEKLIGEMCQQLPFPFASICTTFFDQTLDDIIALIEAGIGILDICKKIGLCDTSAVITRGKSQAVRRPVLHRLPNDVICDLCQEAVEYIEVLVLNDTLKPDIEDLVNQWCQTLPYPISSLCQSYADAYIDDIIEWIEEEIGAFDICAKIGLCASASPRKARKAAFYASIAGPRALRDKNGGFCDVCQEIVQYIEQLVLEDFAKADIEALVAELCATLPSPLSALCQGWIDGYIDEIIADIEAGVAAFDICGKLGLCSSRSRVVPHRSVTQARVRKVTGSNGVLCDICQDVVQLIEKALIDGLAKDAIEALVAAFCDTLPFPLSSLCNSFVDGYIDEIIAWIDAGITGLDICQKIGLCASASTKRVRRPAQKAKVDGTLCDMCQDVVQLIEQALIDGLAKDAIEALVAAFCDTLPFPVSSLCNSFIDGYIDEIIAWIDAGITGLDICQKIGLCASASAKRVRRPAKVDGTLCDMCQEVVQIIEQALIDGLAKDAIEALVAAFCDTLPFPLSSLCNSFIDGYIDEIIAWIDAGITGLNICQKIGLCASASAKRLRRPAQKAKVDGTLCDMCQEVVEYIEKLVLEGFVEEDIEALVADLCQTLPSPLSALCTSWIDGYIAQIIADIEAGIQAFNICGKLGMCGARHTRIRKALRARMPILRRPPGDILCDLCQEAIAYIEQVVLNDTIEADLDAIVDQLCSGLPWPLSSLCISTLDGYIDDIVVWIEQQIDHLQICQNIGLCTTPPSITMRKKQVLRARPLVRRRTAK